MFVSLEDFFENYRIKNQQQPNETVLNRGLMRLKRETRELKALVDILIGNALVEWNTSKIYETDEYVSHNDLIYRSRVDRNFANEPFSSDTINWELTTIDAGGAGNGATLIKHKTFTATTGQKNFVVPFNIDGTPMVYADGILVDESKYNVLTNTEIEFITGATENEIITIISGVTFESSLVIAKERFVATPGQYLFETNFVIKSPSVFVNGQLVDETLYTWSSVNIDFNDPLVGGEKVVIANGSVLGSEIYTTADIDNLLLSKVDNGTVYTKGETNSLLSPKAEKSYVDSQISSLSSAKANWGTTLSAYGITDAYTKTQINTSLSTKLDTVLFGDAVILQKLKNVDGSGSGLDADLLDGLDSNAFLHTFERSGKYFDFFVQSSDDITADIVIPNNEIYLNVESAEPSIELRTYDNAGVIATNHTVYHTGNTSQMMIIREGYFKGSWEPTLDGTFGITEYGLYNWTVVVTPTLTGFEHDYNKDAAAGHTPYSGFDNNLTWDENQSEYHYGYVQGKIVKMLAVHRNSGSTIDIPARYQLIGIMKTFSSYEWVNKP